MCLIAASRDDPSDRKIKFEDATKQLDWDFWVEWDALKLPDDLIPFLDSRFGMLCRVYININILTYQKNVNIYRCNK